MIYHISRCIIIVLVSVLFGQNNAFAQKNSGYGLAGKLAYIRGAVDSIMTIRYCQAAKNSDINFISAYLGLKNAQDQIIDQLVLRVSVKNKAKLVSQIDEYYRGERNVNSQIKPYVKSIDELERLVDLLDSATLVIDPDDTLAFKAQSFGVGEVTAILGLAVSVRESIRASNTSSVANIIALLDKLRLKSLKEYSCDSSKTANDSSKDSSAKKNEDGLGN